jgi:hypothetical protein
MSSEEMREEKEIEINIKTRKENKMQQKNNNPKSPLVPAMICAFAGFSSNRFSKV